MVHIVKFNVFHPEVFDTYNKQQCSDKHNNHIVCYLLTVGDMFRFPWNHHQALSKNTDPLHRTIKTRYGIQNVHNKFMFAIYIFVFLLFDLDIQIE